MTPDQEIEPGPHWWWCSHHCATPTPLIQLIAFDTLPIFDIFFPRFLAFLLHLFVCFFLQSEGQCSLAGVSRSTKRLRSRSRRDSTLDNGKPTCSYCFPCGKLFPFCTYHLLPRRSTSEEPTGTQGKWYSFEISFFPTEEGSCLVLETTSLDHGDIPTRFGRVLVRGISL